MANPFVPQLHRDGWDIRRYEGAGTAETVGRPFHASRRWPDGRPTVTLWATRAKAQAAADAVNAGDWTGGQPGGLDWAAYSGATDADHPSNSTRFAYFSSSSTGPVHSLAGKDVSLGQ